MVGNGSQRTPPARQKMLASDRSAKLVAADGRCLAQPNPAAFPTWPAFFAQYYDIPQSNPTDLPPACGDGPVAYWSGSWPATLPGTDTIAPVSTPSHPVAPQPPPSEDAVSLLVAVARITTPRALRTARRGGVACKGDTK